ncbi:MAG: 50S ribosomal protein L6, partial [Chloroflexi bacterium]|nr:50S ribosomal protein L6 [Chloroflexota bacterium]
MSRVGRKPIPIPAGVEINIQGNQVWVKGPKGELSRSFHPDVHIAVQDGQVVVSRRGDGPAQRALHGLSRALLAN